MRRRSAALAALLACAATAPFATGAELPKSAVPNDRLVLNRVGLPIVWKGRLVNYAFVNAQLKLAPGHPLEAAREKEPYLRDALVRAAHRTPFVDPADLTRVDERALDAALVRAARSVLGPGAALSAEVTAQQPRRRTGLPDTGAAKPAGRAIVP